jgi:hypothetical protein
MIKENFNVYRNRFGYLLINGSTKYVMNISKSNTSYTKYYLKLVEPIEQYITGLFYKKQYDFYQGKDMSNRIIRVKIKDDSATIEVY